MFTGLIEAICEVRAVRQSGGVMGLSVNLGKLAGDCKGGDSVSINGVCLTIAKLDSAIATFEVSGETLAKSNLAGLRQDSKVNVELAMKAEKRFGGHFVLGHVDGTATVKAVERQGRFANIKFAAPAELLSQMVVKGSVTVDGISLTIAAMEPGGFSVALIPQTLQNTTLGSVKIGDTVNIETDIIVKAIKRQLENILPSEQKLTIEKLKESGF